MAIKEEPTISEMFEPEKSIVNTAQLESLWTKNLSLLPALDEIRTSLVNENFL